MRRSSPISVGGNEQARWFAALDTSESPAEFNVCFTCLEAGFPSDKLGDEINWGSRLWGKTRRGKKQGFAIMMEFHVRETYFNLKRSQDEYIYVFINPECNGRV